MGLSENGGDMWKHGSRHVETCGDLNTAHVIAES